MSVVRIRPWAPLKPPEICGFRGFVIDYLDGTNRTDYDKLVPKGGTKRGTMEQKGKKNSCNVLTPERVPAHRFSVTPDRVTVSRYRTPISGIRRLLLHNDPHLNIAVEDSIAGGPLFLNYMSRSRVPRTCSVSARR